MDAARQLAQLGEAGAELVDGLEAMLADVAREAGCYDMWVLADADNAAARATYARAGGREASEPVLVEWELER